MNQTPTFKIVVAPYSNDRGGNEIASSLRFSQWQGDKVF